MSRDTQPPPLLRKWLKFHTTCSFPCEKTASHYPCDIGEKSSHIFRIYASAVSAHTKKELIRRWHRAQQEKRVIVLFQHTMEIPSVYIGSFRLVQGRHFAAVCTVRAKGWIRNQLSHHRNGMTWCFVIGVEFAVLFCRHLPEVQIHRLRVGGRLRPEGVCKDGLFPLSAIWTVQCGLWPDRVYYLFTIANV